VSGGLYVGFVVGGGVVVSSPGKHHFEIKGFSPESQ